MTFPSQSDPCQRTDQHRDINKVWASPPTLGWLCGSPIFRTPCGVPWGSCCDHITPKLPPWPNLLPSLAPVVWSQENPIHLAMLISGSESTPWKIQPRVLEGSKNTHMELDFGAGSPTSWLAMRTPAMVRGIVDHGAGSRHCENFPLLTWHGGVGECTS